MSDSQSTRITRRRVFAAGGSVGALAAAASLLPSRPEVSAPTPADRPAPESGGGYRLTAHVQRYYRSARV